MAGSYHQHNVAPLCLLPLYPADRTCTCLCVHAQTASKHKLATHPCSGAVWSGHWWHQLCRMCRGLLVCRRKCERAQAGVHTVPLGLNNLRHKQHEQHQLQRYAGAGWPLHCACTRSLCTMTAVVAWQLQARSHQMCVFVAIFGIAMPAAKCENYQHARKQPAHVCSSLPLVLWA